MMGLQQLFTLLHPKPSVIYRTIIVNGDLFSVILCIYAGTVILDDISVLILCFMTCNTAVCRKTFSRFAAKCVCVQACTVLIVGKTFEEFCPDVQVVL